jgi:acyl carrier protein
VTSALRLAASRHLTSIRATYDQLKPSNALDHRAGPESRRSPVETTLDLAHTVTEFLRPRWIKQGLEGPLEPHTAVFNNGLLDSVALVDLVATVERASGQTLDMLLFDPTEVETLEELISALKNALTG